MLSHDLHTQSVWVAIVICYGEVHHQRLLVLYRAPMLELANEHPVDQEEEAGRCDDEPKEEISPASKVADARPAEGRTPAPCVLDLGKRRISSILDVGVLFVEFKMDTTLLLSTICPPFCFRGLKWHKMSSKYASAAPFLHMLIAKRVLSIGILPFSTSELLPLNEKSFRSRSSISCGSALHFS